MTIEKKTLKFHSREIFSSIFWAGGWDHFYFTVFLALTKKFPRIRDLDCDYVLQILRFSL